MSAFMCSVETLFKISEYMSIWILDTGREKEMDPYLVIRELYDLNVRALKARYGESADEMIPDEEPYMETWRYHNDGQDHTLRRKPSLELAQRFRCYLYQCSEGDFRQDKTYKLVSECFDALCVELVSRLYEYVEEKDEIVTRSKKLVCASIDSGKYIDTSAYWN